MIPGWMSKEWFFDPTRSWVKVMRFLNLIEDDTVKISLTGAQLWITTFQSLHAVLATTDLTTVTASIAANFGALFFHGQRRAQALAAAALVKAKPVKANG